VKVALLSKAFLPNVGGVESSSAMMARTWHSAGHEVEVVTAVPDHEPQREPYRVTRSWTSTVLARAVQRADIAVTNGYSRVAVVMAEIIRRPLIVFHQGYQLICSDGLGFRDRQFHHFKALKDLQLAAQAGIPQAACAVLRIPFDALAKRWARGIEHVVPSRHVGKRLGLGRYQVIYQPPNPVVADAVAKLGALAPAAKARAYQTGDIVFFGRLVFEKGVDDLMRAHALWCKRRGVGRSMRRLVLYGHGPELSLLERLAQELQIAGYVELRPFLSGTSLVNAAREASVVVIPSRWEEPGATIAVELFACGAAVIASQTGAQGEIFAGQGRLFANGDVEQLARALEDHFALGPVYPKPTGDEPWTVSAIRRDLVRVIEESRDCSVSRPGQSHFRI
jgi:glycosyltransferase involved in cell wall biosynthesis